MNEDIAIKVENIGKTYRLYEKPIDRLKEALSIAHKQYHKLHYALDEISFEIKKGETIGFVGRNGAGKSTLLKILTGVATPNMGTVEKEGKISALLELGAGFNPDYTGMQNIYLNGTMMGYNKEEMDGKVQEILDFADIGEFIGQPVKTYSSGMFARLAFAVAINVEPDILIIDEVLSVGDIRFQIKCMNKMKDLMLNGATVLFVSHDINAVRRFCTRGIWLDKGKIRAIGDINEIADAYMDFLKFDDLGDVANLENSDNETLLQEGIPQFEPRNGGNVIAEVVQLTLLDSNSQPAEKIEYDEPAKVRVVYDVYDSTIENPVLGVAIYSIDDDYICGLNTLLDHTPIPWKYGRNIFYLEYDYGLRLVGGKYYFDVAILEKTATVGIQYIKMVKSFTVYSGYRGEGRLILPHKWSKTNE